MRALTLTQPWAGLVASGIKLVENRPRSMIKREDFGKPFAIHASREIDDAVYTRIHEIAPELRSRTVDKSPPREAEWFRLSQVTSAVIAVATVEWVIDDWSVFGPAPSRTSGMCEFDFAEIDDDPDENPIAALPDDQRRWAFGPVVYMLRDVLALERPVPCRGWQGFWTLPADVEHAVTAQLKESA